MTDVAGAGGRGIGRAVVFPGAGSFGGEFRPLLRGLRPRVTRARYPGRAGDAPADGFDGLAASCTAQIRSLDPAPTVLLGHSFGAYVAFDVARRLEEVGTGPSLLVVLGATSPALLDVSALPADTAHDTEAYLDRIDPALLAGVPSEEWREIVLDAARDDLRLLRGFDGASGTSLRCPIVAARGHADALASDDDLNSWRQVTDGDIARITFDGGHSDYLGSDCFVSWFHDLLAARAEPVPAQHD